MRRRLMRVRLYHARRRQPAAARSSAAAWPVPHRSHRGAAANRGKVNEGRMQWRKAVGGRAPPCDICTASIVHDGHDGVSPAQRSGTVETTHKPRDLRRMARRIRCKEGSSGGSWGTCSRDGGGTRQSPALAGAARIDGCSHSGARNGSGRCVTQREREKR